MSINDISYNVNNSSGTQNVSGGSGTNVSSTQNTSSGTTVAQGYHGSGSAVPGDIISGKITMSDSGNISLTLNDNTELSAHVDGGIRLTPGDAVSFQVKSSDNGLVLTPIGTNTAMGASVEKALAAADLEQSQSNIQMVTQMMDEGMNINASSLRTMNRLVSDYPSVDMTEIIKLKNMNMDITQENIGQLKNYSNAQYQIEQGASEIADLLTDEFSNEVESGLSDKAVQMYKDLLDIVNISGDSDTGIDIWGGGKVSEPSSFDGSISPNGTTSIDGTVSFDGTATSNGLHNTTTGSTSAMFDIPAGNYMDSEQLSQTADILENAGFSKEFTDSVRNGSVSVGDLLNACLDAAGSDKVLGSGQTGFTKNMDVSLANGAKDLVQTEVRDLTQNIAQGAASSDISQTNAGKSENVLQKAEEAINRALSEMSSEKLLATDSDTNDSAKTLVRLLKSDPFKNMVKDSLMSRIQITPEETADKANIKELYEKMIKQTDDIKNVLAKNSALDSPAGNAVQNLRSNIDFMNQINQTFSFVQLPVKLTDGNAHGDLYVYSNKKNRAKNDGNVTALLHLDMAHLGPMDVYITMNSGSHVNTHFYLQDDESLDLISSHIGELDKHLTQRGYTATAEFSMRDEMTDASSEITGQGRSITESSRPISYTSFDARA